MEPTPPRLSGVLETVLYFTDQERTEAFYRETLGMRLLDQEAGRSLFFRAGSSVFLLFNAKATREGGKLPAHGAEGPGHVCFLVPAPDYDDWKTHLTRSGAPLLSEVRWERGRSFYFHDPYGNVLEIANADIWPR